MISMALIWQFLICALQADELSNARTNEVTALGIKGR